MENKLYIYFFINQQTTLYNYKSNNKEKEEKTLKS